MRIVAMLRVRFPSILDLQVPVPVGEFLMAGGSTWAANQGESMGSEVRLSPRYQPGNESAHRYSLCHTVKQSDSLDESSRNGARNILHLVFSNGTGNAAVRKKSYLLIYVPAWLREHGI